MQQNIIKIVDNQFILIQDVDSNIRIDVNDANDILSKLNGLNRTQLGAIKQIVLTDKSKFNDLFITIMNGIASQKNIVIGEIPNVQSIKIGESYTYFGLPKVLSESLPTILSEQVIGREIEISKLGNLLFKNNQVVVVNGLGGIGKTTLVRLFVKKNYEKYKHLIWVTQTSTDIILDFVNDKSLTKNLKIQVQNSEPIDTFQEIIKKLRDIDESPNLLVIDNANQDIERIIQHLSGLSNWHIIITSRIQIDNFSSLELDCIDETASLELFKKYYTRNDISDEQINKLLCLISFHTLTIEIMAKTAMKQRYDFETLKKSIDRNIKSDIENNHSKTSKVEKVASFLVSLWNSAKLNKDELWILKLFSCLPSEFIQYRLLKELIQPQDYGKEDIFSELLDEITEQGWLIKDVKNSSYKIHPIISDIVAEQIDFKYDEIKYLIVNITNKLHVDYTKDNPVDKFQWIPFGLSLIKLTSKHSLIISNEISNLLNELALLLREIGDYSGAKKLLEKALISDEKNFGTENPTTAVRYSNLALVLKDLGDYQGTKVLLEKALISDEKNFGTEHPNTARSYSNLAMVLKDLGDYQGAKELLEKAKISAEKNFGPKHPNTARSYSNLAMVLKDLGDYQGAKELLEKAKISDEENFGIEHPNTAVRYSNLALVLQDLGDYQGAKELLEKAKISAEKNFGTEHPTTAISYSNLASVLQVLGDYQGAKELLEKAKISDEKNFGTEHPTMTVRYSNLALVLKELGDYKGAKELLQKALISAEKIFGTEHPTTALCYYNLASIHIELTNYELALELTQKAYLIYIKYFGDKHPNTKIIKQNLEYIKHQKV